MISRTVAIGSSVGLHARPASVLAEAVDDSGVEVTIAFDGEEADAASLLEIMTWVPSTGRRRHPVHRG